MRRLEGKVVLLTGAASGIGKASVLRMAEEGASFMCADVQEEPLQEVVKEVRELGAEAEAKTCDVSDENQVAETVQACIDRFGRLDSLCNIAGILRFDNTHELALEDWSKIIAVNLTGTFLMCRAAIPHLLAGGGSIVNMASTAGLAGHPWTAAYSASKGGVLAFTYNLAVDYGKKGLRANAVCPGGIDTPITGQFRLPEGGDMKMIRRITPPGGLMGPETVAGIVALLVSDDGAHINGEYIRVDGGTLA